ncbi:DinB family protein [Cohnella soli]|uniref:DinB family protein n=1 Tax=Cohnella soli TaxID=425005 RepID=A0ABW0I0K1_9BACL
MYKQIADFENTWKHESAGTLRALEALTDDSLGQQITDVNRTLGRLAWHLVQSLHDMTAPMGLVFEAPGSDAPVPTSAADIAAAYKKTSQAMLDAVTSNWKDDNLFVVSNVFGQEWPNGVTLNMLVHHEIHHRGQLTVLMRQAGLRAPDLYGPTLEQWAEHGVTAPVV